MVSLHFFTTKERIEELTDEDIVIHSSGGKFKADDGDLRTVADHNELAKNTPVRKNVTEMIGRESDNVYARSVYYTYQEDSSISLFDWIEVIPKYRNKGIGRMFIEETIRHIDSKTDAEQTYLKLENPSLQSVLIDVGFVEGDIGASGTWLVR